MIFGRHINKFYLKYLPFYIVGAITLVIIDLAQLRIPEILGTIINQIKDSTLTHSFLINSLLQLLVISVSVFIGRFVWRMSFFGADIRIKADLRRDMFMKLESLSHEYFNDNKTGAIMALITNDLETVGECFGDGALIFVDSLFLGTITIIKMLTLQKALFFVSFIPIILIVVGGIFIEKIIDKKYTLKQAAFEKLSDFTQENFSGISVVKAYVKEKRELSRFSKINEENKVHSLGFTMSTLVIDILLEFFLSIIFLIIIISGALIIQNNATDLFRVGDLTTFIGYFDMLIWPLMSFAYLINMMAQGYASLKRINRLLDAKPTVYDPNDVIQKDEILGRIEFKDLSFGYNEETNVLNNITFTVNPKEKIGIIGKTGSGKTTLCDLLIRMYNVKEGSLFIDDVDIMKLPLKTLRNAVSIVPQDNFLFGDSVKNNIAFSKSEVVEEDIISASKDADIYKDVMEFEKQFDTLIGERGVMVSGGQKQRISIARSLIKNSPILLLDDAVSAVDTKTEDMIINNLLTKYQDRTIIISSHRVSTIKDLDRILVIDEGRVIGYDSHDKLYQTCSVYKEMVDLQKLEDKVGEPHKIEEQVNMEEEYEEK